MPIHRFAAAAGAALALLAAAPALAEDLTIVYRTTGGSGPGTATSYYTPTAMRLSEPDRDTVIEYGPGRIVNVDHKKKEYSEVTLAEMEAAMKAAAQQMEAMNAQMASLPPAMREKMQGMMGGGAVAVTKGATRKVAGYDCQDYEVTMGTMVSLRLCATTALVPPAGDAGFRRFSSVAGAGAALAGSPMFKGVVDEMKKVQGFPLAESTSAKVMGRATQTSKEATEVRKDPIAASVFDVAALTRGYKKVASPAARMK